MRYIGVLTIISCGWAAAQQPETAAILERVLSHAQAWGALGVDTCVYAPGNAAMPLQIGDKSYTRGLGMHAPCEMVIALEGAFDRFEAEVGVQKQAANQGSVSFEVWVDDVKQFDSGVLHESDGARPLSVSVAGAEELRLVMTDGGDGITCDCANWANVRLVSAATPVSRPAIPRADIAPFGTVVTSDPERMDGVRATRVEPFPQEDLYLSSALKPGIEGGYSVMPDATGRATIGLEWQERRALRRAALILPAGATPDPAGVSVQVWIGESVWQGKWTPVEAPVEAVEGGLAINLSPLKMKSLGLGTEKIRWIIAGQQGPLQIGNLVAETGSPVRQTRLYLHAEGHDTGTATINVYNGGADAAWEMKTPKALDCTYFKTRSNKTDRTVLRFTGPFEGFGVAVEDVLDTGAVYVPRAGVLVTNSDAPDALERYKQSVAGKKTILERVREMPDQTFAQAMEHVHNPVQDFGPMLLSMSCDNRKFQVEREGHIVFDRYATADQAVDWPSTYQHEMRVTFGGSEHPVFTRHLEGDWLPVAVTETEIDGVAYRQQTLVASLDDQPMNEDNYPLFANAFCWAELTAANTGTAAREALIALDFTGDRAQKKAASIAGDSAPFVVTAPDGNVLAVVFGGQVRKAPDAEGRLMLAASIAPGETCAVRVWIPAMQVSPEGPFADLDAAALMTRVRMHWEQVLSEAAVIETPDPLLNKVIRASLVHCLLAARNEEQGKYVAAYISSDRYGALESEAHAVIRGMDLMGAQDYARRSLEYFVKRYAPTGYLTTGYTIMGTGWHLWNLAEHFQRTGDAAWLRGIAPRVQLAGEWIEEECAKTTRGIEQGLVPPGVAADWNRFAYRFFQEGHYYAGLAQSSAALNAIGVDRGAATLRAERLKEAILRSYHATQADSPVLELSNGEWVPAYPGMLFCPGRIEDLIPGEDANRSWAYDVELGAHHLPLLGVLDPASDEVTDMLDHMEDFWFLHSGMGDYPEAKNREDWFNLGGFAKIQPYYARNAELYALRDDVKPFIRSYFNTIPTLLSLENLSFWEHYHNMGGWNKTHETGYFLAQTRTMFVQERGGELWLAPFVPEQWFEQDSPISVSKVPTSFGPVSFTMVPHPADQRIEARIQPPVRNAPVAIVVRFRPLDRGPLKTVAISGATTYVVNDKDSTIRLTPGTGAIDIAVTY